ncbi:transcription factor bHLH110-like [Impatiens glandulifera]|uniref:transcription factor bHLH110-like n=1 Tax=Impatiens glandulifera TaxID=253017 RepID=UPI001FB18D0D|nr:transcription factor bHLH110-like [Impatiens glandulifera]
MESPNLHYHQQHHHHQLQDSNNNPLLPSSSSLQTSSPSCFGPTVTATLPLTSSSINLLNHGNYMNKNNGTIDVDSRVQNDISVHPMISNSMTQDFNYWGCSNNLQSTHDYGSSSSDSYPKFTDLLLQNSSSSGQDLNMMKNHDLYSSNNINHVYPTINVLSAVEMNLEGSDLFPNCGRFSGHDDYGNNNLNYEFTQMQQQLSIQGCKPFNNSSQLLMEPFSKNGGEPLQKKSRSDSRASCPPIKVKKEKLGDRIAALQHLVAPFGKTDTASVLMEAIGYIKFLQNQVETLSVPYMKASHVKQVERTMSQVSPSDQQLNKKEKPKSDLRSRGLCLVPFSCLSYVTDGGGGIWYQDFNGA